MHNHVGVIEVLLNNHHIDPNKEVILDGGTAFSIASEKSHFNVMRALVNGKSDKTKGWCNDNWIDPCRKFENIPIEKMNLTTTDTLGKVIFHK